MQDYVYDKIHTFKNLTRVLKAIAKAITLRVGADARFTGALTHAVMGGRPADAGLAAFAAKQLAGTAAAMAKAELLMKNLSLQCNGCKADFQPKSINLNLADGSFEAQLKQWALASMGQCPLCGENRALVRMKAQANAYSFSMGLWGRLLR
jgi:hypothetical protein